MSTHPLSLHARKTRNPGQHTLGNCEHVLAALDDPDCRDLLRATAEEALTAGELIQRCDIPRSTTYRKVEQLVEAGLLDERVRITVDGKHPTEYRRTFEDVTVSLSEGEGLEVGISHSNAVASD